MTSLEKCGRMKAVIYKGYYDLPAREQYPAIDAFQRVASRLDSTNPPDEAELEAAYAEARPHVERLIERGKLKGDLDGDATGEIGAADPAAPEALKPLGVAAAPVVETTANAKDEPQAAPTPEQHPTVDQQEEPVTAAAPAVPEPLGVAAVVEPAPNATMQPQAQEPTAVPDANVARTIEIPFHSVADIFPMMSDADLQELAQDIKEHGLHEPIWICNGKIIDGRNRYRACRVVGVEPTFREWGGEGSLANFVLSLNLHRRHLDSAQRAMVAARAKEEFEAEALQRRDANLLQNKGSTDGLDPGHRSGGRSAQLAADALNVSRDAVNKAAKILKEAAPELVAAVEQGKVSLDAGAAVTTLPVDEQREIVKHGKVKEKAKELREARAKAKPRTKDDEEPQGTHGGTSLDAPASQAQDEQTSATSTSEAAASTTAASPASDSTSATDATPPSAGEQTKHDDTDAPAEAKCTTKLPQATPRQALDILRGYVRKKGNGAARAITREINDEAGLPWWTQTSRSRDDLSALDDHVADRLETLADKHLDDAKTWVKSHVERLNAILAEREPRPDDDYSE